MRKLFLLALSLLLSSCSSSEKKSWIIVEENPLDDQKLYGLNIQDSQLTDSTRYFIGLVCDKGIPEINLKLDKEYIFGSSWNQYKSTVRVKFDNQPVEEQLWDTSTNGKLLWSPRPRSFIRKMMEHEKLVIGFNPDSGRERFAKFKLKRDECPTCKMKAIQEDIAQMNKFCFSYEERLSTYDFNFKK